MADIKLYNRGKRTILGHHPIIDPATKKPKPFKFAPESAQSFDLDTANKLRRLYPKEILSLEDVKKEFDDKPTVKKETHISIAEADKVRAAAVAAAVAEAVAQERAAIASERQQENKDVDAEEKAIEDGEDRAAEKAANDPEAAAGESGIAEQGEKGHGIVQGLKNLLTK